MKFTVVDGGRDAPITVLEESMGEWHAYFASEALKSGAARLLAAVMDGEVVGAVIYYTLPTTAGGSVTIVYYVAVAPEARRMGVARRLLLSVEERGGSQAYLATIDEGNEASIRLFEGAGYATITYQELMERYGRSILTRIVTATCGYEDSVLAYKPPGSGLEAALGIDWEEAERVHEEICYRPWRRLLGRSI